ncbi:MAG: aspartate 1-decarboxylase [bacterium]
MMRLMLKSKIHGATVVSTNLNYEGSCTLPLSWMNLANILPYEQVTVLNLNNGERFDTYAIPGGEGEVEINGAAARLAQPGDRILILTYTWMKELEAEEWQPTVVLVGEKNRSVSVVKLKNAFALG